MRARRTVLRNLVHGGLAAVFIVIAGTPRHADALDLHGFADVLYQHHVHDKADPERNNGGFAVGVLDFYITESLGPRLDALTEFVIESGEIDLERLLVAYTFSEPLKLSGGRFHAPLGYWNRAYHHGVLLQTTVERPFFLRFEDDGGLLPLHTVGLLVSGRAPFASGELSYGVSIGNGSSIVVKDESYRLDPNVESDPDHNKAVNVRLAFAPAGLHGWTLGTSAWRARVTNKDSLPLPATPLALDVTQTILGADLTRIGGPWEVLAEYFVVRDKDTVGAATATNHFTYVQLSREFRDWATPYARYEQLSIDEAAGDPYLLALNVVDKRIETAGVRFRVGDQSVVKFEGRFITDNGLDSHQEYAAQWAFSF